MPTQLPGRDDQLVDAQPSQPTIDRLRDARIVLPTFAQLAEPGSIPPRVREALAGVGPTTRIR